MPKLLKLLYWAQNTYGLDCFAFILLAIGCLLGFAIGIMVALLYIEIVQLRYLTHKPSRLYFKDQIKLLKAILHET